MKPTKQGLAPGIYKDLDIDQYHADPAIGSSGLKLFADCPYLYYYQYILGNRKTTESFDFGKTAHRFILEPDKTKYIVFEGALRTNAAKQEFKEKTELAESIGGMVLRNKDLRNLEGMKERIFSHRLASRLFSREGNLEASYVVEVDGLMMKARPDDVVYIEGLGWCIIDYKTTASTLRIKAQSNDAFKFHRPIQAAFHRNVYELSTENKIDHVFYVCQMKEEPWLVRVIRMTPEQIKMGDDDINQILPAFKYCKANNHWPDYGDDLEDLITPSWYDYRTFECNNLINFNN